MKNKITKKAVSLLEILISVVLLTLVVGGLTSVFLTVRRYIRHAKERSTATDLAYSYSRTLHQDVRADSWDTGCLSNGTVRSLPLPGDPRWNDIDNINYEDLNTKYEVSNVAGQDYRQVKITIEYPN
ncbi:MAG: hypothetical protein K9L76_01645 [Candidatus Omnitrophica bacterium]|nr:hypothetical protein [Candidatus Omnitrophota bacterium]